MYHIFYQSVHIMRQFAVLTALVSAIALGGAALACPDEVSRHCHTEHGALRLADPNDIVMFNVQNHKFHTRSCIWAKRCTVNCIPISRKEAHSRGGIPCKVCGGGEDD